MRMIEKSVFKGGHICYREGDIVDEENLVWTRRVWKDFDLVQHTNGLDMLASSGSKRRSLCRFLRILCIPSRGVSLE